MPRRRASPPLRQPEIVLEPPQASRGMVKWIPEMEFICPLADIRGPMRPVENYHHRNQFWWLYWNDLLILTSYGAQTG